MSIYKVEIYDEDEFLTTYPQIPYEIDTTKWQFCQCLSIDGENLMITLEGYDDSIMNIEINLNNIKDIITSIQKD